MVIAHHKGGAYHPTGAQPDLIGLFVWTDNRHPCTESDVLLAVCNGACPLCHTVSVSNRLSQLLACTHRQQVQTTSTKLAHFAALRCKYDKSLLRDQEIAKRVH